MNRHLFIFISTNTWLTLYIDFLNPLIDDVTRCVHFTSALTFYENDIFNFPSKIKSTRYWNLIVQYTWERKSTNEIVQKKSFFSDFRTHIFMKSTTRMLLFVCAMSKTQKNIFLFRESSLCSRCMWKGEHEMKCNIFFSLASFGCVACAGFIKMAVSCKKTTFLQLIRNKSPWQTLDSRYNTKKMHWMAKIFGAFHNQVNIFAQQAWGKSLIWCGCCCCSPFIRYTITLSITLNFPAKFAFLSLFSAHECDCCDNRLRRVVPLVRVTNTVAVCSKGWWKKSLKSIFLRTHADTMFAC